MIYETKCRSCGKNFRTTKQNANKCYDCVLRSLIQPGGPEVGDFNTAQILSGEVKDGRKSFDPMSELKDYI